MILYVYYFKSTDSYRNYKKILTLIKIVIKLDNMYL